MKSPASPVGRRLARLLWALALGLAGTAIWQFVLLLQQSRRLESLRDNYAHLARETEQLKLGTARDRDRLTTALQELQGLAAAQAAPAAADSELTAWLGRVSRLKKWLSQSPQKAIPEMKYLSSNDWLAATLDNPLESEAAIRSALSRLRQMAKTKPEVAANISRAISDYANAHGGEPMSDPMALVPFLKTPLLSEILQRYEPVPEIAGQNDANGISYRQARFIGSGRGVLWEKAPVDEDYDSQLIFMKQGGFTVYTVSKLGDAVGEATVAFRAANQGRAPATADELIPYFTATVDAQKLREYWALPNP